MEEAITEIHLIGSFHKNTKLGTPKIKNGTIFFSAVMHPNNADGIAYNSLQQLSLKMNRQHCCMKVYEIGMFNLAFLLQKHVLA